MFPFIYDSIQNKRLLAYITIYVCPIFTTSCRQFKAIQTLSKIKSIQSHTYLLKVDISFYIQLKLLPVDVSASAKGISRLFIPVPYMIRKLFLKYARLPNLHTSFVYWVH